MKLITAEEARGLHKRSEDSKEDPVADAIEAINERVKERAKRGYTCALIGYAHFQGYRELSQVDRNSIESALKIAGYTVKNGDMPKTIRLSWGEISDEE